jgi:hypothetical protein
VNISELEKTHQECLKLFAGFHKQACEESTNIVNEVVCENVSHGCRIVDLIVEVSILESKGYPQDSAGDTSDGSWYYRSCLEY